MYEKSLSSPIAMSSATKLRTLSTTIVESGSGAFEVSETVQLFDDSGNAVRRAITLPLDVSKWGDSERAVISAAIDLIHSKMVTAYPAECPPSA